MSKFLLNLLLQISKALVNSKNPIFNSEILFLDFGPADLAAHPASQPSLPTGHTVSRRPKAPAGPSSPRVGRVFTGNTFSFSVYAFRAGRLSHVSLSTGPHMLVSSPTSNHPSSPTPPPIPGHRAPLSSAPRVPSSRYHLAFISPPLISLLNLSSSRPVFNGVKAINAGVNHPGHPSSALPRPL
jgi:hypothetical protein